MTAIYAVVLDGPPEVERWNLQDWGLACLAFSIDELLYVDQCKGGELGDVQLHEKRQKYRRVESLVSALDDYKQLRPVLIEGPNKVTADAKDLTAYRHPLDAIYVFGGNRSSGLWPSLSKVDGDWVTIDAVRGFRSYGAGYIVGYERRRQQRLR